MLHRKHFILTDNKLFHMAITEKSNWTSSSTVKSPKVYLRWRLRGWSDILEPFYTLIWLRVSTSCPRGQALHWFPLLQLPGPLMPDAPQIFADGVCGKKMDLVFMTASWCKCFFLVPANSALQRMGQKLALVHIWWGLSFICINMLEKCITPWHSNSKCNILHSVAVDDYSGSDHKTSSCHQTGSL